MLYCRSLQRIITGIVPETGITEGFRSLVLVPPGRAGSNRHVLIGRVKFPHPPNRFVETDKNYTRLGKKDPMSIAGIFTLAILLR